MSAQGTLERYRYDYGYDAFINTYNENGEYESGRIEIQLKSTEHLKYSETKKAVLFDLDQRDLELWLDSEMLFIFVLYDAVYEKAYWLDLQDYFQKNRDALKKINKFVRVYIPSGNLLTDKTIQEFRQIKNLKHGKGRHL